jgi:hypothetical protein
MLRELLRAAAIYASGGVRALEDASRKRHAGAQLLLRQLS